MKSNSGLNDQVDHGVDVQPAGSSPSIVGRALLALGLMVGFYALAVVVAGGLLLIVYAEWQATHHVNGRLALFCIIGAGVILWSIVPRPDRFEAPGPKLEPESQPELFKTITDVSRSTGQEMPAEVYLILDV